MIKLIFQAAAKFISGLVLTGAVLFGTAGTFRYMNAWLFICVLFIPMLIAGTVLIIKNPDLLRKRLSAKEEQNEQKAVVALSGLMFLSAFAAAGLCFRFGVLQFPRPVVYAGAAVFILSYVMYAEVMRENVYLSRTVEVQENQKVIDTGLYGIIRHPMYTSTLFLFLSCGIILGSYVSFAILLLYIPIIAKRIKNEEKVLEEGLEGYSEYRKKVKYKVIPFIW